MGEIEIVKPRLRVEIPAYIAGNLFAYEDVLGAFAARIAHRPPTDGPPLTTALLTSERLIAFHTDGSAEGMVAIPVSTVTAVSTPEDAAAGRVACVAPAAELDLAELAPDDAAFIQDILYHAAAGRLYRVGPVEGDLSS